LESAAYSAICEHLQKLHNAGSRPEALFFNSLIVAGEGEMPATLRARWSRLRFTAGQPHVMIGWLLLLLLALVVVAPFFQLVHDTAAWQ
jgi:hypothetical protein